jgi:hypothetical protein
MADRDYVICAPWSERALMDLPGNRTAECSSCHGPVVISVPGLAFVAEYPGVVVLCIPCVLRDHPDAVPRPAPGVMERLAEAGATVRADIGELMSRGRPLREYPPIRDE